MTSPDSKTIEVCVFGPGVGECVLLYLGDNRWFVVDSCVDEHGAPVALDYLDSIGVAATKIAGVLVTHWHDDHIGGVASILEAAPNAKFYCPTAFKNENLLSLVKLQTNSLTQNSSGVSELASVFEVLMSRRKKYQRRNTVSPELVMSSQRLIVVDQTELWALSPSSAEVAKSLQAFADLFPEAREAKRAVRFGENHASIVLQLTTPFGSILLGADKERQNSPSMGWNAIVSAGGRPRDASGFYKVAHHGAPNGDDSIIWDKLLEPQPIAVVTPYRPAKRPREDDIARIKARAGSLHLTASPIGRKPQRSNRLVDKMMASVGDRRRLRGPGMVRVRLSAAGRTIEHFGAAQAL